MSEAPFSASAPCPASRHAQRLPAASAWLALTLAVALAARALLWFAYAPVAYSDTNSYHRTALAILGGWELYDGTRTPGYPGFVALFAPGADGWQGRVWLAQLGLGVVVSVLMFYLGWQMSGRAWLGAVAGLTHTLNLGQLFFEANLLTETLTTFWITLAVAGMALWLYRPRQRSIGLAFAMGAAASLSALTRPLFIYLPAWILLFVALLPKRLPARGGRSSWACWLSGWRLRLPTLLAFILPVMALLGGWVTFIHTRFGDWGMTTMTGYHLIQHTGVFFEYVPDEYANLRDTYLRYRDAHIARYGTQANTIWEAIPEMQRASGLSFYDLSRTLARISLRLIREHPDRYLRNCVEGWWLFWRAPVYWSAGALRWEQAASALRALILAERVALFGLNLAFIGASLAVALLDARRWLARRACDFSPLACFTSFLAGTIWLASLVQTLLDHGDNPRFLIPLQSLVVIWAIGAALRWRNGDFRQREVV